MGRMWWLIVNAVVVSVIHAAPRELSTDELITEPRPGEEYVNIQTASKDKFDLVDKSFTTSHRIPQLSKTNRSEDFQTSHKIPTGVDRSSRSLKTKPAESDLSPAATSNWEPRSSNYQNGYSVVEGTTNEPPLERVVTRTSIKMSKSKKVQKSVVKVAHDELVEIKADEGLIDERPHADEEEREIMRKKFSKNEKVDSSSEEILKPTRFNVPFEDEVKAIDFDKAQILIPNPVIATTQEPPITTFNYKNIYDKTKKGKGFVGVIPDNVDKVQDKYKYETVSSESIKTAESKTITSKKDTKQEKKDKSRKEESNEKEESGFYLLPVNKQSSKVKEDNFDFVDLEEKVLVPAGSSPSQSSRINIKKGPNGQEYEYEYVYYYYDDDEDGNNGGGGAKEGKVVASTTEKIYNGHDGPAKVEQDQNVVQSTSTSGNKYLPTEATQPSYKGKKTSQTEVTEESEEEVSNQFSGGKNSRGGSNGSNQQRFSSGRQPEPVNNEVLPSSGRPQYRSRGRSSSPAPVPADDIPAIGEERLPANTRFPPRARANNPPATSPQPQETTARTRGREGSNQNRLRIPNLGLLDSSSFRTHASDASVEEDSTRETEFQRKPSGRGQTTETSYRRGTRPTATPIVESADVPVVTRRPTIRKPVEDRRPKIPVEEDEEEDIEERQPKTLSRENEKLPRVPLEENERRPKVPTEEAEQRRPKVPTEEVEQRRPKVPSEDEYEVRRPQVPLEEEYHEEQQQRQQIGGGRQEQEIERRPQTTRESDAEEGVFENSRTQTAVDQGSNDENRNVDNRPIDATTENQAAVGLTGAMMEKVALDLYAILQQTQNENIQTNFVDGNSTDVTTDVGEDQTEYSTYGDSPTAAPPSTTTTTTTTTTTPAPTTTTTTTTPAPTQALGRGRYRNRVLNGNKGRSKVSTTTTTTEVPEEVSSPRTRGRFHPIHATRGSGPTYGRRPTKPAVKEPSPEEAPASEETPRAAPERTFGDRPRNRFRASAKVTSAPAPTAAPPAQAAQAAQSLSGAAGNRGSSIDRYHSRRRGGTTRTGLPATQHSNGEGAAEEERHETHQEPAVPVEEAAAAPVAPSRPSRPRIGGAVRPLRPGPRAPLLLPQRGHAAAASSTTPLPVEHEEVEKEVLEPENHALQPNEEVQEPATTPAGDALTRLKSRPRLRIGPTTNHQRPQTPVPPAGNRRKLVSSLLPKRKPNEEKPVEKVEEVEEKYQEEIPVEEEQPSLQVEPSSTTAEPEAKGLSGLLAGRRRNLNRRPGTIYSRAQPTEA